MIAEEAFAAGDDEGDHDAVAAANLLTIDEIDPFGKIPEFKFCAVRIDPTGAHADPLVDSRHAAEGAG